ncbi:MAG: permease-like cell division protein FtsX [Patescibacteria group bacterium]
MAIFRQIKFGLIGFFRNGVLSVVSVTILTMALLSSFLLMFTAFFADSFIKNVEQKFDFSLEMKKNATEFEISESEKFLKNLPEIKSVQVLTSEDQMKELLKELNRTDLENVDLELPTSINIVFRDPGEWSKVLDKISASSFSENFANLSKTLQDESQKLDRLSKLVTSFRTFLAILMLYFISLAIVIIFNTTKLSISSRSREIEIMKLVGAGRGFIINPFVIEAIISAIISIFLTFGIVFLFLEKFNNFISKNLFADIQKENLQLIFNENFPLIFGAYFTFTILLVTINTTIATKKFLKI